MDGKTVAHQLGLAAASAQQNIRGLTHEESVRAPGDGGNCANWVLGHMLAIRFHALRMLDLEMPMVEDRLADYVRGTDPEADGGKTDWLDFRELKQAYKASQKAITAKLREMDEEAWNRPLPEPTHLTGETVGSAMAFFAFHDAYHAGQLGMLRRSAGKPGAI